MPATKRIALSFTRQFKHLADLLTVTINRYSDELWFRDDLKRTPPPAWEAYHAVSSLAMGHILDIPAKCLPHDPGEEPPPSRKAVLALLDDVRKYVTEALSSLSDEQLLAWTRNGDGTCVENLMYAFRHTHHHVGLLIQILRERGGKPPQWSSGNML
ncbi:MAG: DinB family protein [Planctomycetota bacterium]|jgi:hypothetical protein